MGGGGAFIFKRRLSLVKKTSQEGAEIGLIEEAPRVLALYEAAFLKAVAEKGVGNVTKKDLNMSFHFGDTSSTLFNYSVNDDARGCVATAKKNIGDLKKGGTISSWMKDTITRKFEHGFSGGGTVGDNALKTIMPFLIQK